ncbi:MAG: MerR family transcriptional regulator [Proteobacteria bacterium]|nr:MerR family transcriptional regulator [Pseudomonadota bacterium]
MLPDNHPKAPGAFRTIGEVATELGLPQHVLRFWESKFTMIKPHKRRGGHRYYRPQDVEILKEVKALLHEKGFTIKGAQKFLSTKNKSTVTPNQPELFGAAEAVPASGKKAANKLPQKDVDKLKRIFNELCELKDILNAQ